MQIRYSFEILGLLVQSEPKEFLSKEEFLNTDPGFKKGK
jgi:hypothetical protein